MRKTIILLPLVCALLLLTGCAAHRTARQSFSAKYAQALEALDQGRFLIRADEVYLPDLKKSVDAFNSYLSVDGTRGVMRFSPDLFPAANAHNIQVGNIESDRTELRRVKRWKNGDVVYEVNIRSDQKHLYRQLTIKLYHDTNACYVQVSNDLFGYKVFDFNGRVYPLSEQ